MVVYILVAVVALLVGILLTMIISRKPKTIRPIESSKTKEHYELREDKSNKFDNKKEDWQRKINNAREEGYKEGREAGYADGKRDGYNTGKKDGLLKGIEGCFKMTMPELKAEHVKIDVSGAPDEKGYVFTLELPWEDVMQQSIEDNSDNDDEDEEFEGRKFVLLPYYIDQQRRITFKEIEYQLLDESIKNTAHKIWQCMKNTLINDIKNHLGAN